MIPASFARYLLCFLILAVSITYSPAQSTLPSRATITAELEKRGIDAVEFERRMARRGINLANLDPNNPQELMEAQRVAEQIMAEMQKETEEEGGVVGPDAILKDTLPPTLKEETLGEVLEESVPEEEEIPEEEAEEEMDLPKATTWGQEIFRNKNIAFYSKSEDGNPPANYMLGTGDKVNVAIWGLSEENLLFEINEAGFIKPPLMSRIYLKGLTFTRAKELLKKRFRQYYRFRDQEFDVTLSYSRSNAVSIVGEVYNFGTFEIPGRNSAFNALVVSGGPTNIGSVRNIRLIRSGEADQNLDVYEFLTNPSVQDNFFLQDNDVLFVPVAEKVVSINGAVNRPHRYELKHSEGLQDLINFAGGLQVDAYPKSIQVIRTENGKQRIMNVDVQVNPNVQLKNGDQINVLELTQSYENYVSTSGGGFDIEDDFELSRGMKVSDLIIKAGITRDAELGVVFLERVNLDSTVYFEKLLISREQSGSLSANPDFELQPRDKLILYAKSAFATNKTINIKGAVRNPGSFNFDQSDKLRAADILMLAGGVLDDADSKAYILRQDFSNPKVKSYVTFNVTQALSSGDDASNPLLMPNDEITIFSSERYTDDYTISIEGAVRNPGTIPYGEGLKLEDALNLAGGMRLEASAARVEVIRVILDDTKSTEVTVATLTVDKSQRTLNSTNQSFELQPYDNIIVREVPDFEFQEFVTLSGEVKYPGKYALLSDNENIVSVINRAGGLTSEAFPEGASLYRYEKPENGFVILDLDKAIANPSSRFNQVLKKGDEILIPVTRGLVSIETNNTNAIETIDPETGLQEKYSVSFQPGKSAKFYLDEYVAGVNNQKGLRRKVAVRQANGRLDRTKKFLFFNLYPKIEEGSTIIVGDKPTREERYQDPNKEPIDWGKVAVDTLSVATSAISLILLVDRINQ